MALVARATDGEAKLLDQAVGVRGQQLEPSVAVWRAAHLQLVMRTGPKRAFRDVV